MTKLRYIIVDETTGEVVNTVTIADGAAWPPPFAGFITLQNKTKRIGMYHATPISESRKKKVKANEEM